MSQDGASLLRPTIGGVTTRFEALKFKGGISAVRNIESGSIGATFPLDPGVTGNASFDGSRYELATPSQLPDKYKDNFAIVNHKTGALDIYIVKQVSPGYSSLDIQTGKVGDPSSLKTVTQTIPAQNVPTQLVIQKAGKRFPVNLGDSE